MIVVSGKIYVQPGRRNQFLAGSLPAMTEARRTAGCRDFVVAADPIEEGRVNVYEEWDSSQALAKFRGSGPGDDLSALIIRAEVQEREIP